MDLAIKLRVPAHQAVQKFYVGVQLIGKVNHCPHLGECARPPSRWGGRKLYRGAGVAWPVSPQIWDMKWDSGVKSKVRPHCWKIGMLKQSGQGVFHEFRGWSWMNYQCFIIFPPPVPVWLPFRAWRIRGWGSLYSQGRFIGLGVGSPPGASPPSLGFIPPPHAGLFLGIRHPPCQKRGPLAPTVAGGGLGGVLVGYSRYSHYQGLKLG